MPEITITIIPITAIASKYSKKKISNVVGLDIKIEEPLNPDFEFINIKKNENNDKVNKIIRSIC